VTVQSRPPFVRLPFGRRLLSAWREHAACTGYDPVLWDPDSTEEVQRMGVRICRQCPVRQQCLTEALRHREVGVWGGKTDIERETLRLHTRI